MSDNNNNKTLARNIDFWISQLQDSKKELLSEDPEVAEFAVGCLYEVTVDINDRLKGRMDFPDKGWPEMQWLVDRITVRIGRLNKRTERMAGLVEDAA